MSDRERNYTDARLYGPGGQPQLADIDQDAIFDCYLLAPMGALAAQQPDRIREAIRFQPDPDNSSAGVFTVTMHHPTRGAIPIEVSQADVEYNISRKGGGTADNQDGGPIWPSVMEAAFAKLHDPRPQNDNRREAYEVIGRERDGGGSLSAGMFALTGDAGENLRIGERPQPSVSTQAPKDEGRPPFAVQPMGTYMTEENAYSRIRTALDNRRPVALSTRGDKEVDDGLMEGHAYTVTDIQQRDGHIWLTLRNPYANNQPPGDTERGFTPNASIAMRLDQMQGSKALGDINIGPASRSLPYDDIVTSSTRPERLEGGPGHDTYRAGTADTIMGKDGRGELLWSGRVLTGGSRAESDPPNTYRSADGEYTYTLAGTTLTVANRQGEAMQVEHYARGDLGLRLEDPLVRGQGDARPEPSQAAELLDRIAPQDRAVYEQMLTIAQVQPGPYTQEQRENIAAAGLAEFKCRDGVVRQADEIAVYGDRLFAAYFPHGKDHEPNFHANVRLEEAANTPARDSFQQMEALTQQRSITPPAQQIEQQQGQNGPTMGARAL